MKKYRSILALCFFAFLIALPVAAEKLIILKSGKDRKALEAEAQSLGKAIRRAAKIVKSGEGYRLILGPLPESEKTASLYFRLKQHYPSAHIIEYFPDLGSATKSGTKTLLDPRQADARAILPSGESDAGEYRLWIALFALAFTGILALFFSSRKMQQLQAGHERILRRHEEIEQRFNELFQRLGERIYHLSNDIVQFTSKVADEIKDQNVGEKLKRVVKTENRIMDATSNLLDFLRLRSKKVSIRKERFEINSMLEDIVEMLLRDKAPISEMETELIFSIDREVPKYLTGDFVHMGEALSKLLEHAMTQALGTEVRLDIRVHQPFTGGMEMQCTITYYPGSEEEDLKEYFVPRFDEETGTYRRLGCFVAHELIELMGGKVTVGKNPRLNQVIIDINIPVAKAEGNKRRKYRLKRKEYTQKKVLIVNRSYDASLALKEMFAYFRHEVQILNAEEFEGGELHLEGYDILAIDEGLVDSVLAERLELYRRDLGVKIVGLRNIFAPVASHCDPKIFDARETKPMNFKRVVALINGLYGSKVQHREKKGESALPQKSDREFWEKIPPTPRVTLGSFRDFSGSTILVVEDNEINMKMLLRILGIAGLHVIEARNGQEALEAIEDPRNGRIDLVLMDINMPVMDGLEATRKIRALAKGVRLPIVALSALNNETERARMKEAGMDGYLPKPLEIRSLYTLFDRYLRRVPLSREEHEDASMPDVEGIVMEEALERTQGSEMLLREIFEEFLQSYGDSDQRLKALYDQGNYLAFQQMVLDVLGISGTIGAQELHGITREIYRLQFHHKMELIPQCLSEYETALSKLRRSLSAYLRESGGSGETPSSNASHRDA
ncbi:ATP-binding response regulator [Nitratifractor sp.]